MRPELRYNNTSYHRIGEWLRCLTFVLFGFVLAIPIFAQIEDPIVFAGNDIWMCRSSALDLHDLNASISGSANDGYWHTMGDGYFSGSNTQMVRFSEQSHYYPGPDDLLNGQVALFLISDDPDGNGAIIPVRDFVTLFFIENPVLACNSHLNLTFDENCMVMITAELILQNQSLGEEYYRVELFDENGYLIPDNMVMKDHHNQILKAKVTYLCTGNSCWSNLTVRDHIPPAFECTDRTVSCLDSADPDDIGLPIPEIAIAERISESSYRIINWDFCSEVNLMFVDDFLPDFCKNEVVHQIVRTWTAEDQAGNAVICEEVLEISNPGLGIIEIPLDLDDEELPSLDCLGDWPRLANGYPSPDTTGIPHFAACRNFELIFDDEKYPLCGNGYKLLREWLLIDWCSAETRRELQFIYVRDKIPPTIECSADTIYFSADPYDCLASEILLQLPGSIGDCSEWSIELEFYREGMHMEFDYLVDEYGLEAVVYNIPVGEYDVHIRAIDECGFESECSLPINIWDDIHPIAICGKGLRVFAGQNGVARIYAEDIDDGSLDNCGIQRFEARKLQDLCAIKDEPEFSEYIDFCCEEIGSSVDVLMRLWDVSGNYNDCQTTIHTGDKLPPAIYCPPDLTIECRNFEQDIAFDVFGKVVSEESFIDSIFIKDSLGVVFAGMDGFAVDNCGLKIENVVYDHMECNTGIVERKFIAIDLFGNSDSCIQQITVIDENPFVGDSILWPEDLDTIGCQALELGPEISGLPQYLGIHCGMITQTYSDQVFSISTEQCMKIIRKWTVIDWCQYNIQSKHGPGIWSYDQELKITDTLPPQFEQKFCRDTVICIFESDCMGRVILKPGIIDDCSPSEDLDWHWSLDIGVDGAIEETGVSGIFESQIGQGMNILTWTVEDGCGNINTCRQHLELVDCKAPVAYCRSEITTVVMASSGSVSISAQSFDLGSFDNCTSPPDLRFSFDEDAQIGDTTFYCADTVRANLDSLSLRIWISDLEDNIDYCDVRVHVQTHESSCRDPVEFINIRGKVLHPGGKGIAISRVHIMSKDESWVGQETTDEEGSFIFTDYPSRLPYVAGVQREDEVSAGISVVDLVQVQRHILQFSEFQDPFKLLAADVNQSASVSASDLIMMQRALLGYIENFPKSPSWKFYPSSQIQSHPDNPWAWEQNLAVDEPGSHSEIQFYGIKLGDVNYSVDPSFQPEIEIRHPEPVELVLKKEILGEDVIFEFEFPNLQNIEGLQMGIEIPLVNGYDFDIITDSGTIGDSNFSEISDRDKIVKFCWVDPGGGDSKSGINFRMKIPIGSYSGALPGLTEKNTFHSMAISDRGIQPIGIIWEESLDIDLNSWNIRAFPNPFTEYIEIEVPGQLREEMILSITNIRGQVIHSQKLSPQSSGKIIIGGEMFRETGTYFVHIQTSTGRKILKIVKV